jgi:hypothetical protein
MMLLRYRVSPIEGGGKVVIWATSALMAYRVAAALDRKG